MSKIEQNELKAHLLKLKSSHLLEGRARNKNLSEDVIKSIFDYTKSCAGGLYEKIYWVLNDLIEYPSCKHCGILCIKMKRGNYLTGSGTCSMSCSKKLQAIQDKTRTTCLQRYGVDNPMKSLSAKEKSKNTCLQRYGVDNPQKAKAIQDKTSSTMMQRYGQAYPRLKSYKKFTLPSGKIIRIQGYEDKALNILLQTYREDDLDIGGSEVNPIGYFCSTKNKTRRYYTDIYIKSLNKIIEVKSAYLYNCRLTEVQDKIKAAKLLGLAAEVWVFTPKGTLTIMQGPLLLPYTRLLC